jgi:hypothetical protein
VGGNFFDCPLLPIHSRKTLTTACGQFACVMKWAACLGLAGSARINEYKGTHSDDIYWSSLDPDGKASWHPEGCGWLDERKC